MAKARRSRLVINENTKAFIMQAPNNVIRPMAKLYFEVKKQSGRTPNPDEFIIFLDRFLRKIMLPELVRLNRINFMFSEWHLFCRNNIDTATIINAVCHTNRNGTSSTGVGSKY